MNKDTPPIPAATLVLMRPGTEAPELLALERAAKMAFAPGAIVFPGGRIDAEDNRLAERIGAGIEYAAARITAIRETIEEVGMAVGFTVQPQAGTVAELRRRLHLGEDFADLLESHGLALDLEALTPLAHWCPRLNLVRRFDTLFFVAEAVDRGDPPAVHEAEVVHSFWASARHILDEAAAGRLSIIFPTRRNLERIAQYRSFEEARADAHAHPVQKIVPWMEDRDGVPSLCIPEGLGYPVTSEPLITVRRGSERVY